MEKVLKALQSNNYGTLVFTPWFIACIYLLTILLLFWDLYVERKQATIDNKIIQ
jgi:hypothetical protein